MLSTAAHSTHHRRSSFYCTEILKTRGLNRVAARWSAAAASYDSDSNEPPPPGYARGREAMDGAEHVPLYGGGGRSRSGHGLWIGAPATTGVAGDRCVSSGREKGKGKDAISGARTCEGVLPSYGRRPVQPSTAASQHRACRPGVRAATARPNRTPRA